MKTISTGSKSNPTSVSLGDLNQDHTIDIIVVNHDTSTVGLFFGYGNGTFSMQKIHPLIPAIDTVSIIVSDINNDTFLDIVTTDYSTLNSYIRILYGFGDGNFTFPKLYSTGLSSRPTMIATGDFNNDGKVDLATSDYSQGGIGIFIQEGSEPFGLSAQFSTGNHSRPNSVVIGHFNNDNHSDIAVTNSLSDNIGILLGYGNGDCTHQITLPTGINSLPSAIIADHFDDDPYLDIAVINTASDSTSIFIGNGNGKFSQLRNYSTGVYSLPVAIASKDMNRDGHTDMMVANRGSNEVLIFLGMGNGSFHEPKRYPIGYDTRPQSVAIGRINDDGMLDIAVANDGAGFVEILLQTC